MSEGSHGAGVGLAPAAARAAGDDSVLQRQHILSELLDSASFTEVCRGICELYRIGLKVYEEKGPILVDLGAGSRPLCACVFEQPRGRNACASVASRIKDGPLQPGGGARVVGGQGPAGRMAVTCFTGCEYLVMPIRLEGDVLGRVVFGPFVHEELQDLPPALKSVVGDGFDWGRGRELLRQMRRAPEATISRVMGSFSAIVDALVFAGQKTLLSGQVHLEAMREAFRESEAKNLELSRTNARLRELDRLKSSFLATVSHELRTPLTSVIGYSEMLVQGMAGPLNPEQDDFVRTILEKGECLLSLIGSILDVTQIEAGRVRLVFGPGDVNEVVRQAVSSVGPQVQKKGLGLETQLAPTMRRPAMDRDKIRQCLVNLLTNSVKFTPEGGRIRVSVLPEAPPGLLAEGVPAYALVVEDNGIGVAADQYERVFETFYQVDQSSTRQYGGAGLGLAIVRSFVEAHSGKVKVESTVGRFTRFVIALPYAPGGAVSEVAPPF